MAAIWQLWWVWAVAGLAVGILEVAIPGFIFLGFAIGGVAVGLFLLLGGTLATQATLAQLILLFAVASVLAWLVLRRVLGVHRTQVKVWKDNDVNDN
jgi:membrane protein implicated in regulation of membrane protease activity